MPVPRDRFRLVSGENQLTSFESSSGKFRSFCRACGSQIVADRTDQPIVLLRLGCLDTPIDNRPLCHIWRSDCATWYDPKDMLPEFQEAAPRKGE